MDFQFDHTIDGHQVKILNIIDEFTSENLAIDVEHSIGADNVVAALEQLVIERGCAPAFVRFDNGPEFVAIVVGQWCASHGVGQCSSIPVRPGRTHWHLKPGRPTFNSRFRDELLNLWIFDSLLEAKVIIEGVCPVLVGLSDPRCNWSGLKR